MRSIHGWTRASRATDARAHAATSRQEWTALSRRLTDLGAAIELVPPAPDVPDLVFTANAAVVLDRQVLLARFRHPERQREEPHFEAAFRALQARGLVDAVRKLPQDLVLEGAGDCVWDRARNLFWMGYGPRSDAAARAAVEEMFGQEVIALELADQRFYHMDTALCPLPRGEVLYRSRGLHRGGTRHDPPSRHRRPAHRRRHRGRAGWRPTPSASAMLVMSGCGARLRGRLEERGYQVVTTPLGSFLRSGGAVRLTLRLDLRSGR